MRTTISQTLLCPRSSNRRLTQTSGTCIGEREQNSSESPSRTLPLSSSSPPPPPPNKGWPFSFHIIAGLRVRADRLPLTVQRLRIVPEKSSCLESGKREGEREARGDRREERGERKNRNVSLSRINGSKRNSSDRPGILGIRCNWARMWAYWALEKTTKPMKD